MNYKYPLLNLVTRGHLNVKNRVAMENFINGLDNDSCATILENLLFNVDSRDCARKLDNLLESYEFKHHIRKNLSESTINNARDKILMEYDELDAVTDMRPAQDSVKEIIRLAKIGMFTAIAAKFALMDPKQKEMILKAINNKSTTVYNTIISNPILASVLPQDKGFAKNALQYLWTFGKQNNFSPSDREYLSKLGRFGKGVALVAAGITTSIIAVNIAYKQLFSAEAKKCKGLLGKKRTICMCNAIITAAEEAQKKAEENLLHCDESKDPQECRYKMKVEIRSWMKKIEEQKKKLARLEINKQPYPTNRPDSSKTSPVPVGTASDPFAMNADTSSIDIPSKSKNPFG